MLLKMPSILLRHILVVNLMIDLDSYSRSNFLIFYPVLSSQLYDTLACVTYNFNLYEGFKLVSCCIHMGFLLQTHMLFN
jgi:hypothetical protein